MSEKKSNHRLILSLIALVAIAPFAGSYLLYHFMPPTQHINHGDLLETRPLTDVALRGIDGNVVRASELKGKWLLLTADRGACDEYCQRKLYIMRQLRLTQGKEMDRIERVWVVVDESAPEVALLRQHEGTRVVKDAEGLLIKQLPAVESVFDHIYVVDPLGNLVLRYRRDPDTTRMIKDLGRLLKASRIG